MTTCGRIASTLRRMGLHVVNMLSDLVGDDIGGRAVRRAMVRMAGASVPASTHLLGGTFFSRPSHLRTGERCLINRRCYLDLHAMLTLEDDVVIGNGTSIITSRHAMGPAGRRAGAVVGAPVVICSGAWVGANVTILPGVVIGPGAVVAAGAVVTSEVAADVLVAGVPARQVRLLAGAPPNHATGVNTRAEHR